MTHAERLARLVRGVGADLRDYRELQALLEEQFEAALRHRAAPLAGLAETIGARVEMLEARRRERVELVEALIGAPAPMSATFGLLGATSRPAFEAGWQALEDLVRECRRLNARNGRLMTDQQAIMQRVLNGEGQTYAPL